MARYIPPWAFELIITYRNNGLTKDEINQIFYSEFPEISKRAVRHWTRSYFNNNYKTETIQNHRYGIEPKSIVPLNSQREIFFEEVKELHKKIEREDRLLKIVNSQDSHIEDTDPALIELRNQIVSEFKPDIFPILMDDIDNKLISPHEPSHNLLGYGEDFKDVGVQATLDLTEIIASSIRSVVGRECILVDGGGNHNDWLLRLLSKPEARPFASNFFKQYFEILKQYNVHWVDGHKNAYLPITDSFIFMHGRSARKGYGSTSKSYLNKYEGEYSICAGHSHRQETVWSHPSPKTGERYFANICGTLGNLQPDYAKSDYLGHNWGFSLVSVPVSGMKLATVEDIVIYLVEGYYTTYWRGKIYREKATKEWRWTNPYTEN